MSESLANYIVKNELREYCEPFAGGAGAAIILLRDKVVEKIRINDADIRIFSAWHAIINETDRFIDRLKNVNIDINEWHRCNDIIKDANIQTDLFEVGFATFILNRINRSGIILGGGPIGGYQQRGKWKVDARFYRETLCSRVEWLGHHRNAISLTNKDGVAFLRAASKRKYASRTLFLIDSPYVGAGNRLYLDLMTKGRHAKLANFLQERTLRHWFLTYDDCREVQDLYSGFDIKNQNARYSLYRRRNEREIFIMSNQ